MNPIYQWWGEIDSQNTETNVMFSEYKSFRMSCPSDMSPVWKLSKKGSASKNKYLFCYCCDTTSEFVQIHNNDRCGMYQNWVNRHIMNENKCTCYHHNMITVNYHNIVEKEYDDFKKRISNDAEVLEKKSKLKVIIHHALESKEDPNSIDYEASTLDEKRSFYNLLISEIIMRNISIIGLGYESIRAELKMCLNREHHVK